MAATGGAAAAAGLAACSSSPKRTPSIVPTREDTTPTPDASPAATADARGKRGETLRYAGLVATGGKGVTADPHKTQSGPLYGHQSLIFSRLISYRNQATGELERDLSTIPEQPDQLTYIFHVNPAAKWHQRTPLDGRQVTGDDVKFSIERQALGDASFPRKARWAAVERVEVTSPGTVRVTTKEPNATLMESFADVTSFIVPPEISIDGRDIPIDLQVGSGPFRWVEWLENRLASVARNPAWFGGSDRPYLDGVDLVQATNAEDLEGRLRAGRLDVAFVGRAAADKLKKSNSQLQEQPIGNAGFYGMRFYLPQVPFNDPRFRQAVSIALDRRAMVDRFFGGAGGINPWVSWPVSRWTLPQNELTNFAGYRAGQGGRDADISEARALLAAAAAARPLDSQYFLFVVDDAEASLGLGTVVAEQLKAALDLNVTIIPKNVGELVQLMLQQQAPWVLGPDSGQIDLDDWVYPYFHSKGTKNTFAMRDAELDTLIDAQRVEFDPPKRQATGYEIQRRLLTLTAGVNLVSERVVALAQPYVREFPLDITDGYQGRFADCWLDRSDPSFRLRA
jgi:peptide/nickel transport system substrate-binding protein